MQFKSHDELFSCLHKYVDGQLSSDEERDFLRTVQTTPAYLKLLNQEQSFRDFIRLRIMRRKASPALIENIKRKIAEQSEVYL